MAIAFGSITSTTTATGLTIVGAKPSGTVDGDLLIAFISTVATGGSASVVTPPAGWTQISTEQTGPGTGGFWGYIAAYKKIAASEGSNYTFAISKTADGTRHLIIARYTGANGAVNQVSNRTDNPANTTRTADSVTTTVNNCMLLYLGWDWLDTSATETPPSGMTERYDVGNQQLYWADELQTTAGSTGTRSNTCQSNSGSPRGAYLVALEPASTGITGTLNQTIDPVTLVAAGDLDIKGSLAQSVGEVTQAASAKLLIAGSLGATIAPVAQSAAGAVIIQGNFGQTVGAVTLDATGSAELPTTNGTFNVTIDNVVLLASGRGPSQQRGDDAAPRHRLPAFVPEIREEEPEKPVVKRKITKQVVAKAIETIPELPEWWAPKTVKAILPPFIEVPKSRDAEAAFYAEIREILARKAQEEADDEEETILLMLAS